MLTTILAYVIALAGVVMIAAGAWDLFTLVADADNETVQEVSDYAMGIGTIATGLALVGLAQALRLLLKINARVFTPTANLAETSAYDPLPPEPR